jgi:hypothetical protein
MWDKTMGKRGRGFIRVFEAVLFTFLLFGILIPNFFRYYDPNDWASAKNKMAAQDMLFALEKNQTFDEVFAPDSRSSGLSIDILKEIFAEGLKNNTEKAFPASYDFEYEVKNVPPSRISIGCLCNESDIDWLKSKILTPSHTTSEFSITHIAPNNLSDSFDMFIIFGQQNLEPYRSDITSMLNLGKGFVLVANLSSEPDNMTKELFDTNYNGGPNANANFQFTDMMNPTTCGISKRYAENLIRIYTQEVSLSGKLYLKGNSYDVAQNPENNCINISSCSPCLRENQSCLISGVANITLYQIDPLYAEWADIKLSSISSNSRNYTFSDYAPLSASIGKNTLLADGTHALANAVLGNYSTTYETEPRRFWIYQYGSSKDDLNLMLKTGIIWSSGEHFFLFKKEIPGKRVVATHFYTGLRSNNIPFSVSLYTWGY